MEVEDGGERICEVGKGGEEGRSKVEEGRGSEKK